MNPKAVECEICCELIAKENLYIIPCNTAIKVHDYCLIEWIQKTPLSPPRCPWCQRSITDAAVLDRAKKKHPKIAKIIFIASFILIGGLAIALINRPGPLQ